MPGKRACAAGSVSCGCLPMRKIAATFIAALWFPACSGGHDPSTSTGTPATPSVAARANARPQWSLRAEHETRLYLVHRCYAVAPLEKLGDHDTDFLECLHRGDEALSAEWEKLSLSARRQCERDGLSCCFERVGEDADYTRTMQRACDRDCGALIGRAPTFNASCSPRVMSAPREAVSRANTPAVQATLQACKSRVDLPMCERLPTPWERQYCRGACLRPIELAEFQAEVLSCAARVNKGEPLRCDASAISTELMGEPNRLEQCEDACHALVYGAAVRRLRPQR
jgi:hypothetical protein